MICKPPAHSGRIVLVVVLVIETHRVEHEDENDDEDDPPIGFPASVL